MYSTDSITHLVERIGFGLPNGMSISIDVPNQTGTSGRTISSFHRLATLKNLYETVEVISMDGPSFNSYLLQLKTDAVKSVVVRILNQNNLYLDSFDYSGTIITKTELFDEAVGYAMAISAIEQFISTTRTNSTIRSLEGSYKMLKIELEGAKNNKGVVVAVGLRNLLTTSIKTCSDSIFPNPLKITSKPIW
ncbi:MAG: hypothetical protein HRT87_11485 [Legionellales bacterium]|nr:hypothetical protein [Legionellales bacterium]